MILKMILKVWRRIYVRYVVFYDKHAHERKKIVLKVMIPYKFLAQEGKKDWIASSVKIVETSLDKYLFERKAMVFSNVEVWVEENIPQLAKEFGIRVTCEIPDKYVKLLPMPKILWRKRVLDLDKWWNNQHSLITETSNTL